MTMNTTAFPITITDLAGNAVKRIVASRGYLIVQVKQSDGSWWNINQDIDTPQRRAELAAKYTR